MEFDPSDQQSHDHIHILVYSFEAIPLNLFIDLMIFTHHFL